MPARLYCDVCNCILPINLSGHVTRVAWRDHREGRKHRAAMHRFLERAEKEGKDVLDWFEDQERRKKHEKLVALAMAIASCKIKEEFGSVEAARDTAKAIAESIVMEESVRPSTDAMAALISKKMVCNAAGSVYSHVQLVSLFL